MVWFGLVFFSPVFAKTFKRWLIIFRKLNNFYGERLYLEIIKKQTNKNVSLQLFGISFSYKTLMEVATFVTDIFSGKFQSFVEKKTPLPCMDVFDPIREMCWYFLEKCSHLDTPVRTERFQGK